MIRGILALSMLLVGCLLSGHVLAAPVTAPSSGSAIAGEVATVVLLDSPDVDDIEPYGLKSKCLKEAIRKLARMLRSTEISWVVDQLGALTGNSRIAKLVHKHARLIADKLDELAKWGDLSLAMVRDQLIGALKAARVPDSTSTEMAFWIVKLIDWVLL